jgi:hypothetical protein
MKKEEMKKEETKKEEVKEETEKEIKTSLSGRTLRPSRKIEGNESN